MDKLFVKKSIEIKATPQKVWDVLTKREYSDVWAVEFSNGELKFHIVSDWKPGSPVLWKSDEGKVIVQGNITALERNQLLRFTVSDTRKSENYLVNEEDGITFKLLDRIARTRLYVIHGDFSVMKEGEKYYTQSGEVWDRALPVIKQLAELPDSEEHTTCGKGLAESAALEAKLGDLMVSIAENMENHMKTLDFQDIDAGKEYEVYQRLAKEHREIAFKLNATARHMAQYRTLPVTKHHEKELASPKAAEVLRKVVHEEKELLALLENRMHRDKKILKKMPKFNSSKYKV